MRKKVSILMRGMILTLLLTLLVGSMVVHAEGEAVDDVKEISTLTPLKVNIGEELRIKPEGQKEGDRTRWISYNVNVASVDQNGVVTPLRKGTAIISSGIFPRKTCLLTVVDPSVKLNKTAATLYCSVNESTPGNTVTLKPTVKGADKAAATTWSSSNAEVAKVEKDPQGKGVVTALKAGEAVITAKVNGRTASCRVTVQESTVSLNVKEMQLSTKGAGSSIKLVPTVIGKGKTVTWNSDNTGVAVVKGGKVTGKAEGTATITATANGVAAKCTVNVKPGQISIDEEKVLLYVPKDASAAGETKVLKTNAAAGDTVEWSSSDSAVAEVDDAGKVTAKGAGAAVITAKCSDKTDTCIVEVKTTATTITESSVTLRTKGADKTYKLGYEVIGRNSAVKWASSNPKVVSVSKGKITAKKSGFATVTMTANGVKDEVQVMVQEYTPTIALNQKEYTLYTTGKGNTVTLKTTINGASKKTEWKSDDKSVAEVKGGKVTARGKGRALITATANGVTAKCYITVREPKILFAKNAFTLKAGEKKNLRDEDTFVEILGANQSVTYKSDKPKVAAVSKKGVVTARKEGMATITAKANGAEYVCYVFVRECAHDGDGWLIETLSDEYENLKNLNEPAACVESGRKTYMCKECKGLVQVEIPPTGHIWGAWTVISQATDNEAGLKIQKCKNCDEENKEIIPAKNTGELDNSYKLVWEDNFDKDALDRSAWNVELHEPGWVNAELQEYVDSEDNIYVKDGNLVIQAIKDGDKYTSGRVNTQNKHDYLYGRFEARAKVPSGKGFLPAFWMMPTDESYYGQWPKCGEIDVMEVLGDQTKTTHSTLHFGEPHTQKQGTYTLSGGTFADDFHVYACEWEPGEFRFYVDGHLFYTENDWFTKKPGFGETAYPAPYDQPFYMILNLAVGGSWVGYPDETTRFEDNAQLVVDYVRVYQKDDYDIGIDKPTNEVKLRDPDATGNYIINGDFSKVEDLAKGDKNWQLLLTEGGKAAAKITDQKLHIETEAEGAGTVNYSVQVVQAKLPIEEGKKYKLSYEAYADEARTIITNVTAPDLNYTRYLADTTVELTTEPKTFEHTFDMKSGNDANGRVEFNLGNQGSTAAVHIDNVRLEQIGDAEEEVKSVLPDGNYVYNGSFDEGNESGRFRLAYWDWDIDKCWGTSVSVTNDSRRELRVDVPATVSELSDVVVNQNPIAITGGKEYVLSFDAHADQEKTIKAEIAGETFESALTADRAEYKYSFKTAEDLKGSELRFLLGAAGTTYIDNVCIRENGMIVNGDFSSGMTGYELYVHDDAKVPSYIVDSLNEENALCIDIADTADQAWKIQLKQNNIKLEKGKWYKLAFDAKATKERSIMYALQRDGSGDDVWTPYSGEHKIKLTGEYQNFSHTFEMTGDTDPRTILSISMGAIDAARITDKHTVVIDNITLEETDPIEKPPVEAGENLIKNGDFAQGDENWENAITAPGAASASFADGKAAYDITNVGTADWNVQLKQSGLTLEKDAQYEVSFKIKSSAARTVKYAFLTATYDWYGGEDLALGADEVKEVRNTITVNKDTDSNITFVISMGKIDGEDTPVSAIEIDDISVVKVSGGERNLIKNGDFAQGDESWDSSITSPGAASASFADGKAAYDITNVGTEDWHIQLKQSGLTLEKDAQYEVSFKIKSSAARTVKYAFLTVAYDWYGGEDLALGADEVKEVKNIITVDKDTDRNITFVISMGKIAGEDTQTSAIEIDDISVVKLDGTGNDPEEPGDPVEIGTELIRNGNFEDGMDGWSEYIHTATGTDAASAFTDNKARYEILNAGKDDWNVQLKQEGLAMEKGASYKVNFKIGASIDRDVRLAIMGASDAWCGGSDIHLTKNKVKSFSQIVTLNDKYVSGTVAFQISMGQLGEEALEAHAVEISEVSVTKVEDETEADKETEEEVTIAPPAGSEEDPSDPSDPEEPGDPVEIGTELIRNGNFEDGMDGWSEYIHKETGTDATSTFTGNKARYEILNAGKDDWNVQLKQEGLAMEKGARYKVNFKIGASIDRDVRLAIMGASDAWCGGSDIHLTKNKVKSFSQIVTLNDKYVSGTVAFQISMGQLGEEALEAHAVEISEISITKVEDETEADKETEEEVTITPPAGSEEEPARTEANVTSPKNDSDDGSGNDAEVQSDQNTENADDTSDDTTDATEADSTEQETPDN